MLPIARRGKREPTFVLMHFLAGSGREWDAVAKLLAPKYQSITLDLPGFGDASAMSNFTVDEMVNEVAKTLRELQLKNFVLVGHSLSGKLALVLAARKIAGLKGLVLIGSSPPSPEPMKESNRKKMLAMPRDRQSAQKYLDGITAQPLVGKLRELAIIDFLRTAPKAWEAWLRDGSAEDWAAQVGLVDYPALVITGDVDPSLHARVQVRSTLPHLRRAQLKVISKCGHLPTIEKPKQLSTLMAAFMERQVMNKRRNEKPGGKSHG